MKPQLTVLIPLVGLGAYLICKPSKNNLELEENKATIHSNKSLSDSVVVDSLNIATTAKTVEKTKE